MEERIKFYRIDSKLSKKADLIICQEKKTLKFEIREYTLLNDKIYTVTIGKKGDILIKDEKIIKDDGNKFRINNSKDTILSKNSHSPFEAKLYESGALIAECLFYRYCKTPKKSPAEWDENFDPEEHLRLESSSLSLDNSVDPKSEKNKVTKNLKAKEKYVLPISGLMDASTSPMDIDINFANNGVYSFMLTIKHLPEQMETELSITQLFDKLDTSNRAIVKLKNEFNVKKIAHFKINIEGEKDGEVRDFLIEKLKNGIKVKIDNTIESFCYIGSSNSGRRESNFWAIDKQSWKNLKIDKFLERFGKFTNFSQIEKLNKRYSLLFTTCKPVLELKRSDYKVIDDTKKGNYCFTDGVGVIRQETCEEISKKLNLEYTSYVFQIRMGGFKGVLTGFSDKIFNSICPGIDKKVKILFRKSQEKFESYDFGLNIVSWATNASVPASLNSEIAMILDGLCGQNFRDYILAIFEEYLDEVDKSLTDPKRALIKLFNSDLIDKFTHKYKMILLACRENLMSELDPKQYKIIYELIIEKCLFNVITKRSFNINIEKSRFFIGVIDETESLNEGEVFISYRDSLGNIEYLNDCDVLVCRVPCYSVTEARKVRAKYVDELSHLENCVVFSKKGSRPLTDILSGGDLDGDLYFVSWNDKLLGFQNIDKTLEYPKDTSKLGSIDWKNLKDQLVEVFVDDVVYENKIGLWHYYLTCSYNLDRKNMLKDNYLEGVKEINKCIDGIKSKLSPKIIRKPVWYISSKDLIECMNDSRENKINFLKDFLDKNKSKFDNFDLKNNSLLACLIIRAIKKYADILDAEPDLKNGEFLNKKEIKLLESNNFIVSDYSDRTIEEKNFENIKKKYQEYIEKIKKIDNNSQSNKSNSDMFKGVYERQIAKNSCSEKDKLETEYINEFRDYVVNMNYFKRDYDDKILNKSIYSIDGLYFRSRVINLYKTFKNDEKFYQIPWMFYDVLCLMKNFCNDRYSERACQVLPVLIPFSISAELTNTFSSNKLLNKNF